MKPPVPGPLEDFLQQAGLVLGGLAERMPGAGVEVLHDPTNLLIREPKAPYPGRWLVIESHRTVAPGENAWDKWG